MSNFVSLSVLQGANYILPLITLPYLIRVLGVENYGLLAFATAVIAYLAIITDYGFNVTATRSISINRENHDKVTEIFSSVMQIKFILMLLSFLILVGLIVSFEKFAKDWEIYILSFGTLVGQFLFPTWFFQGMERMKYTTYLNILSKSIFTVAIFVFIQEKNDLYLVPLLTSLGFLVAGIWSLMIIKKEFGVSYQLQTISTIKQHFQEGWHIFVATLSGNLYGQGNVIILGLFATPAIVGYYSLAQKLSGVIISIFQVLTQTLLPYLSKLREQNYQKFFSVVKKIMFYATVANSIIIGSILLLGDFIYHLVSGYDNPIGYYSFSFWLCIAFLTIFNVLFNPIVIALKQDKFMSQIYLFVGISFTAYGTLLTSLYSYRGMLYAMLMVELLIFTLSLIAMKRGFQTYGVQNSI
jgi:PST family polysaccharide transporter